MTARRARRRARTRARTTRFAPRTVVVAGALVIVALFVAGALCNVPRIQRDLRHRAAAALDAVGVAARVDMQGQDATVRCADPLPDPDLARRALRAVRGMRGVTVDPSCTRGPGVTPTTAAGTVPPTTIPPSTVPDTVPDTGIGSTPSTTTSVPVPAELVAVDFDGGIMRLQGTVGSQAEHLQLVDAANAAIDPTNVRDALAVDPAVAVSAADVNALTTLLGAMPRPLAAGRIGRNEAGLFATGISVSETATTTFQRAAAAVGIATTVILRSAATPQDATAVADQLNEMVAATPIQFAKGKAVLAPGAAAVLQRVAGIAKRFGGLSIEVQGHTDSVGSAATNLTLSIQRAQTVRSALVNLGVPAADLTAKGFGSTQPIRDQNGKEIPDASRRVVFAVRTR